MHDSDVTAVVLSIGEPSVDRALESLAQQTQPPAAIVRIDGVTPFHRALNAGLARVTTAFFVQVDADTVLDPTALADLRACMAPGVALAVGGLRDPLRGSIVGIKLYRTVAAAALPCPDSVTPAVDFLAAMRARGWLTAHALAYRPGPRALWHTFGEHAPDYTPDYTFAKFRLLGARYRHWRTGASLRRLFASVQASGHPAAALAQAALAHGLFWPQAHDALRPVASDADAHRLAALLAPETRADGMPARAALASPAPAAFVEQYRLASALAQAGEGAPCRLQLEALAAGTDAVAWVALVGFCRGLLDPVGDAARAAADFAELARLFPGQVPP